MFCHMKRLGRWWERIHRELLTFSLNKFLMRNINKCGVFNMFHLPVLPLQVAAIAKLWKRLTRRKIKAESSNQNSNQKDDNW